MFISFLGLGQAGGNISDEASKNGFYSAAINFSQRDLDSLEYTDLKLKLIGSEGIGKQRSEAIRLMNNNWDLASNFVKENFSHPSIEIIFVPFATAGGSGSGTAPILLNLLTELMPDKVFVAMPIIPSENETYTNQRNCLETFEDLSQLNICVLPIDNDKARSTLVNVGKNNLYKSVNESVVSLISKLVSYTDRHSKYGVLDRKDLRAIFNTKGLSSISEVDLSTIENSSDIGESTISHLIQQSWNKSYFADIEYSQIISSGFIFDGQERLMDIINTEKVFSKFNNKMPANLFEGYYKNEKSSIITVLSGLSWCNERLERIDKMIEENKVVLDNVNQNANQPYKSRSTNTINFNPISNSNSQPKKQPVVKDISSIINKFKR